jgi:hypothetical protein
MLIWDARGIVHEFIAALRLLRRPLVRLAVAILLLQAVVAGLASGHVAAQIATFGADGVICHGTGDDGSAPARTAVHDCCVLCTGAAPATLVATTPVFARLTPAQDIGHAENPAHVRHAQRAIRAGPSQAPPSVA